MGLPLPLASSLSSGRRTWQTLVGFAHQGGQESRSGLGRTRPLAGAERGREGEGDGRRETEDSDQPRAGPFRDQATQLQGPGCRERGRETERAGGLGPAAGQGRSAVPLECLKRPLMAKASAAAPASATEPVNLVSVGQTRDNTATAPPPHTLGPLPARGPDPGR